MDDLHVKYSVPIKCIGSRDGVLHMAYQNPISTEQLHIHGVGRMNLIPLVVISPVISKSIFNVQINYIN